MYVELQYEWRQRHLSVGHADEQNVVQAVNAINLRQQLVDERVMYTCAYASAYQHISARSGLGKGAARHR
jgi:hypothetical protein